MSTANKDRLLRLEAIKEKQRRLRKAKPLYRPHRGQEEVHKSEARIRFVTSGNGCHAPGTRVRMFDGSVKAVEDVQVGDLLLGPDSSPRKVLELHRGRSRMARIVPKHSDPYEVNVEHVLSLYVQIGKESKIYVEMPVSIFIRLRKELQQASYQWRPKDKTTSAVPQYEPFTVGLLDEGEYYGFEVDADHLFLLDNYVVQHNSGKTCQAVQEALAWATGYNHVTEKYTKVPATIIVLLDNPLKVDTPWLNEIRKWYDVDGQCELLKNGKPYVNEIRFKNGSKIIFMFHAQESLVFEGIELDYLIADEPFPRHAWIGLQRGMRTKKAKPRSLIIGTPLGQPWMYEEI